MSDSSTRYTSPTARDRLTEYTTSNGTMAMIQDRQNADAWIRAAETVAVER